MDARVVFPLVYYTMLTTQKIVFARYLLPLTPAVCLLAAIGVVSGVSLLRRYEIPRAPRTALIAGLTIAALLPSIVKSINTDREMARANTIDQAYSWIVENIPAGAIDRPRTPFDAPAGAVSRDVRAAAQRKNLRSVA